MKTLHETKQIDAYLQGKLKADVRLVFEARMLINPLLKLRVDCQRKLYAIIVSFGRRKIRFEADQVHQQLFNDPARVEFQQSVLKLFPKK